MTTTALIRKMAGIPMSEYRAGQIAKQMEAISARSVPTTGVSIKSKPPATFGEKVTTGAKGPILFRKKTI